jgi:transposase
MAIDRGRRRAGCLALPVPVNATAAVIECARRAGGSSAEAEDREGDRSGPQSASVRRRRRRFTAEAKARIVAEADACTERGALGDLLRKEGIHSSHLANWRAQLKREGLPGLQAKRRGPKPVKDEKDRAIERLEKQKAKLAKELSISQKIIELQRKAHEILGVALPRIEDVSEDDSSSSSDSATERSP